MPRKVARKGLDSRTKTEVLNLLNGQESRRFPTEKKLRERLSELIYDDLPFWYQLIRSTCEPPEITPEMVEAAGGKEIVIRDLTANARASLLAKILDKIIPDKREAYTYKEETATGQLAVFHFGAGLDRGTAEARERALEHRENLKAIEVESKREEAFSADP